MLNDEFLDQIALLKAEYDRRLPFAGMEKWFQPGPFSIEACPKHRAFFDAGALYLERLFMAANRSGKSLSGAFETTCHLTGLYPVWWAGKKFDKPISAWACSRTGITTRDTVQKELLGDLGRRGEGMIPADLIIETFSKAGISNGIDTILVRHVSGGVSKVSFRSYDQDVKGFQGTAMDVIWLDEECPQEIYNECLIRTMTTGGIIFVTFTAQMGITQFILNFHKTADLLAGAVSITAVEAELRQNTKEKRYKAVIQAGWDDAPWLSEDAKQQMLNDTMPYLRKSRSTGLPGLGSGNVYPIDLDSVLIPPFPIPAHYKRLYAMDVGWNNTAALFLALDPETQTSYIYAEYKGGEKEPAHHANRIKELNHGWMPGVIDPASRGRSQVDGAQLLSLYRQHGLKLRLADNGVDSGLKLGWDRLSSKKVFIFNNLFRFLEEFAIYRRDEKGRIIKEFDHLMDCFRYLMSMLHHAQSQQTAKPFSESTEGGAGGRTYKY